MPTYEYRCNDCKIEFEVQQKMSDPDLLRCDACGKDGLEKLISWTSVRSTSWQSALFTANPREAMKGMNVVDRSKPPPPKPAPPPPAPVEAAAEASPSPADVAPVDGEELDVKDDSDPS